MLEWFDGSYEIGRLLFQRGLAFVYFVAFLVALKQFRGLMGSKGLTPIPAFLKRVKFWDYPSLFHWHYSDRFFAAVSWLGILLSLLAMSGFSEMGPIWLSMLVWFAMWLLYLSIVNVGQTWYAFGWESQLLETGFLAIFLGPIWVAAPMIVVFLLRWVLFRIMFGAGLIKMRGDTCWKDLTALYYHYETQPMPNVLSWRLHHLPKAFHRFSVASSHFIQLLVPFALFLPQPGAAIAGGLILWYQFTLILSGNLSFLNYITLMPVFLCFSDAQLLSIWPFVMPVEEAAPAWFANAQLLLLIAVALMSIPVVINLFSSSQRMNMSFNSLHLVNTYGAFGSITKVRYEIILEGTSDSVLNSKTKWREYEFKAKPGDPKFRLPSVAPYHLRLDWLMWFAAMGPATYYPWIYALIDKLLQNDKDVLSLIRLNPFPKQPPRYIRARLFRYHFSTPVERKKSGVWWKREFVEDYLLPRAL